MVVPDLGAAFPGADSGPDVCGDKACIVRTRIPFWLSEQARRLGVTEQALLAAYPARRADRPKLASERIPDVGQIEHEASHGPLAFNLRDARAGFDLSIRPVDFH